MLEYSNSLLRYNDCFTSRALATCGKTGFCTSRSDCGKLNGSMLVVKSGDNLGLYFVTIRTCSGLRTCYEIGGLKSGGPLAPLVTGSGDYSRSLKLHTTCAACHRFSCAVCGASCGNSVSG